MVTAKTMVTKKITRSGSITLPRQVRQKTGLLPGVPVKMVADQNGIHLSKHVPACFNCGSVDDVKEILGIEICRSCAKKVWRCFDDGDGV